MTSVASGQSAIIRTERGLTIAGTRITVYDIMDYLAIFELPFSIRRNRARADFIFSSSKRCL